MGSCFVAGGIRRAENAYGLTAASTIASLALTSVMWIVVLEAFSNFCEHCDVESNANILSRAMAIALLILYGLYLYFESHTHARLFDAPEFELEGDDTEDQNGRDARPVQAPFVAAIWLLVSLALVVICARPLVMSFSEVTTHASPMFLGTVVIPFLGNTADFKAACMTAYKNQMDIVLLVTLGSSMQILLFTFPSLVLFGWMIGKPMTFQVPILKLSPHF